MGYHFALVGVEAFLNLIQLALCAAWGCIGRKASNQKADGNAGYQGNGRYQPGCERLFHESFLSKRLCFTLTAGTCAVYRNAM
jgi:hypothetical protein